MLYQLSYASMKPRRGSGGGIYETEPFLPGVLEYASIWHPAPVAGRSVPINISV